MGRGRVVKGSVYWGGDGMGTGKGVDRGLRGDGCRGRRENDDCGGDG